MGVLIEKAATVTSKGQVTIPVSIRKMLGLKEGDPLVFRSDGETVTVVSGHKPTLTELLSDFDPKRHRHSAEERPWDDGPVGEETL